MWAKSISSGSDTKIQAGQGRERSFVSSPRADPTCCSRQEVLPWPLREAELDHHGFPSFRGTKPALRLLSRAQGSGWGAAFFWCWNEIFQICWGIFVGCGFFGFFFLKGLKCMSFLSWDWNETFQRICREIFVLLFPRGREMLKFRAFCSTSRWSV